MKLVEAEDTDTIYKVFSPGVRENAEELYGQIQEFIRFIEEYVTAWDFPREAAVETEVMAMLL